MRIIMRAKEVYDVYVSSAILPIVKRTAPLTQNYIEIFLTENEKEIQFAKHLLEKAADNTVLHSHLKNRQLSYINSSTGESIFLTHSYIKINGRIYIKLRRKDILGEGSFATVKQLIDVETGERVAIKLFKRKNAFQQPIEPSDLSDFSVVKISGSKKSNPLKSTSHLINLSEEITLNFFSNTTHPITYQLKYFQLYPYLGISLADFIKKIYCKEIPFGVTSKDEIELMKNKMIELPYLITKSLSELHDGKLSRNGKKYTHNDIKACNIMVLWTGKEFQISLCDLDFALEIQPDGKTEPSDMCGTPLSMSPELLRSFSEKDFHSIISQEEDPNIILEIQNRRNVGDIPTVRVTNTNDHRIISKLYYTTASDIFSLGLTLSNIIKILFKDSNIFNPLLSLSYLMRAYHPNARPKLLLMKLAFFYIYWSALPYQDPLPHQNTDKELENILLAENLPILSSKKIVSLTQYLVALSVFAYKSPESWPILTFFYNLVESIFIDNDASINTEKVFYLLNFVGYLRKKYIETDPTYPPFSKPILHETVLFLWNIENAEILKNLTLLIKYPFPIPANPNEFFQESNTKNIESLSYILCQYNYAKYNMTRPVQFQYASHNDIVYKSVADPVETHFNNPNCYSPSTLSETADKISEAISTYKNPASSAQAPLPT